MNKRTDYRGKEMMWFDKDTLEIITHGMNDAGLNVKLIRYRKNPRTHLDPVFVLEATADFESYNELNGIDEGQYKALYFVFANKSGWEDEYSKEDLKKIYKYFKGNAKCHTIQN